MKAGGTEQEAEKYVVHVSEHEGGGAQVKEDMKTGQPGSMYNILVLVIYWVCLPAAACSAETSPHLCVL